MPTRPRAQDSPLEVTGSVEIAATVAYVRACSSCKWKQGRLKTASGCERANSHGDTPPILSGAISRNRTSHCKVAPHRRVQACMWHGLAGWRPGPGGCCSAETEEPTLLQLCICLDDQCACSCRSSLAGCQCFFIGANYENVRSSVVMGTEMCLSVLYQRPVRTELTKLLTLRHNHSLMKVQTRVEQSHGGTDHIACLCCAVECHN